MSVYLYVYKDMAMRTTIALLLSMIGLQAGAQEKSEEIHIRPFVDVPPIEVASIYPPQHYSRRFGRNRMGVCMPPGTVYLVTGVAVNIPDMLQHEPSITDPYPYVMCKEEIQALPLYIIDLKEVISLAPHTYQRQRGNDIQIGGSNTYGTLYVVDGIRIAL